MVEKENKRVLMLICAHCGHHDLDGDELLEIDFKKQQMVYVCRNCHKENIMVMKSIPLSYPRIGIR